MTLASLALLAVGCADEAPLAEKLPPRPSERLEAMAPGLADAARAVFGPDEDDLRPAAELLSQADRGLVRLLVPTAASQRLTLHDDLRGEARAGLGRARGRKDTPLPDLVAAGVTLDGTVLRGEITGEGVGDEGGWVQLDTRGGPAPDLLVGFGHARILVATMDDWAYGPQVAIAGTSTLAGDTVRFSVDLASTGRIAPGHAGAAVAMVRRGERVDVGPAGLLGRPAPQALAVLAALMDAGDGDVAPTASDTHDAGDNATPGPPGEALRRGAASPPPPQAPEAPAATPTSPHARGPDVQDDPDLAVAVALAFGPWRAWVAPEVRAVVEADAVGWFTYGLDLDPWLARKGVGWTLQGLTPEAKLAWATPSPQAASYGALALSRAGEPLSLARYRFSVPDADTLTDLRDLFPLADTPLATAEARDAAVWEQLTYRASDAGMEAVCAARTVRSNECADWKLDRAHRADLGIVDGVRIPQDGGVSVTHQLRVLDRDDSFVGDCATATTLAIASFQAVGLPGLAVGYAGDTWATPTHDMPLVLVGERFLPVQAAPSARWEAAPAWVYVHAPALEGSGAASLGNELGGWSRGPAVAGGRTTYGALSPWLDAGVPLDTVMTWARAGRRGDWGEITP